jgi:thiosulfate/3-mercaptopyruvate sulfurtransferase
MFLVIACKAQEKFMDELSTYAQNPLISPSDLQLLIKSHPDRVALLDASYAVGANGLAPDTVFQQMRIGNAQYFDIDAVADQDTPLPHMLPQPSEFSAAIGQLGINNDHLVIVYDQTGIAMAAARAWWMFRVFGHDNVCVLDGGMPAWLASGLPFETGDPTPPQSKIFNASYRPQLVKTYEQMRTHVQNKDAVILDSRPPEHFAGLGGGSGAGHMPGAFNLPAASLIDRRTRGMMSDTELQNALQKYPLHSNSALITTCGSGVTACVTALALFYQGYENISVYDGSWTEWSLQELSSPVIKGFE